MQITKPGSMGEAVAAGRLEVRIEGLGFRGEGWVAFDDGWLSIPGALPGEVVIVDVAPPSNARARRIWGTLREVVTPSPRRGDPHCGRVDVCRGCQLRHVAMVEELTIKSQTIVECLEKFAGVEPESMPQVTSIAIDGATRADAFRVRSTLSLQRVDGRYRAGLRAPMDALVPMGECPALADSARRAVARVEAALERFVPDEAAPELRQIRVASPVHGHGYVDLVVERHDPAFDALGATLDELLPRDFGVAVTDGRERRHLRGPERIRLPMADLRLEVGFDDWFHATLEPAEKLYEVVGEWLGPLHGTTLLDAGCGVGTIGLIAARQGAQALGFDLNPASVETAELNAMNNDLQVEFRCAAWERALRELTLEGRRFETVVINPMREPLGPRPLAYLERLGAQRVLYLGPSAGPAAKDVGALRAMGWQLERLGAANLHPATYHVMMVALLVRR